MSGFRRMAGRMAAVVTMAAMAAVSVPAMSAGKSSSCADCAAWNQPQKPFRIYGNTWYVGTAGLASVLVTSEYGHVLLDGGLPESAPQIAANIQALGFKLTDVKAIVSSHPHFDHAGGIAELQKLTGAQVHALRAAEETLRTGKLSKADPQYGVKMPAIPPVPRVWVVQDDQLLGVGSTRMRVLETSGHAPGGASWIWDACEGSKCFVFAFADSLTPVSAPKYRFRDHPEVVQSFERSFARLEATACEILIPVHPDAALLQRLQKAEGKAEAVAEPGACKRYVDGAREALKKRLAEEG